ncbi:MAG: hypothetical protein U1E22_01495 [Coriobacteriia bacterium]|nr:hypothetical protein [Coriobacteriia bacterium]
MDRLFLDANVPDPNAAHRLDHLLASVALLPSEPADFAIEGDPSLPAKDRPVLRAAIVSKADHLLTGDLTRLGPLITPTLWCQVACS